MCWVIHNGKLAYMLGHCWSKPQFEGMKAKFGAEAIALRMPSGADLQAPLKELEYDSSCVKQPREVNRVSQH